MRSFLSRYGSLLLLFTLAAWFIGRYIYFQPRYTNGVDAPTFSATLANGEAFALAELRGRYVLLDFWGSWCGPCRAQSDALRELYQTYQAAEFPDAEGFTIVSVGIEKDSSSWRRAIVADQLNWPYHLLDGSASLRFFDAPIANLYGVKSVPTSYLLNPAGQIIGVNLEPRQVDRLLKQRLSN